MAITIAGGLTFSGGGLTFSSPGTITGIVPVADAAYAGQGWVSGTNATLLTDSSSYNMTISGTATWSSTNPF